DTYDATSLDRIISVAKDTTTLAYSGDTAARVGHTATLAAHLIDTAGPIYGAAVRFDFQGATYDATTNTSGVAMKDVTVQGPVGIVPVHVAFAGDPGNEASTADSS